MTEFLETVVRCSACGVERRFSFLPTDFDTIKKKKAYLDAHKAVCPEGVWEQINEDET